MIETRQPVIVTAVQLREGWIVVSSQAQPGMSDAELILQVRLGDEAAMALLYDRYARVVYSVASRILCDSSTAEDILQEVFMQLWRNPQAFDASRGSLGAWLAVVTRHRAIDQLRQRRPETNAAETVIAVDSALESTAERSQAVERIRTVLESMPSEQRTALEMAFFEGMTHREIAGKTGQPLGTVKTRIRAGLLAIRRAFATA
jgi:RNA polymerase sigma-70 factor (ECF subfamily)